MRNIRDAKRDIVSAFKDAKRFDSEVYPPKFVGYGRARYLKTGGETEVQWNADGFRLKIYSGSFGDTRLDAGEIELEGDLLVKALYDELEMYIFSRSGLLKAVAEGYRYVIEHQIETPNGERIVVSEKEYWPSILENYLKRGSFDTQARFGRQRTETGDILEMAHFEEAQESARTLKGTYDGSKSYRSVVPLKSIKPFLKAPPKRIAVEGDGMRMLYVSHGGNKVRHKASGGVYLFSNELSAIPVPCLVKASGIEFPIRGADVRELVGKDRIKKDERFTVEGRNAEIYINEVGEAEIAGRGSDVLNLLVRNPMTYVSLGLTVGLPVLARVVRVARSRYLLLGILAFGVVSGIYSLIHAFGNAERRFSGDDNLYLWLKGEELTEL